MGKKDDKHKPCDVFCATTTKLETTQHGYSQSQTPTKFGHIIFGRKSCDFTTLHKADQQPMEVRRHHSVSAGAWHPSQTRITDCGSGMCQNDMIVYRCVISVQHAETYFQCQFQGKMFNVQLGFRSHCLEGDLQNHQMPDVSFIRFRCFVACTYHWTVTDKFRSKWGQRVTIHNDSMICNVSKSSRSNPFQLGYTLPASQLHRHTCYVLEGIIPCCWSPRPMIHWGI